MTRLLVVAALCGAALTVSLAWSLRTEVAHAEPIPPPLAEDWLPAAVTACLDSLGLPEVQSQGQLLRFSCRPGLGLAPVKRGSK